MRPQAFAVIGGDRRQVKLAAYLAADGHRVSTFALDQSPARGAAPAASLEAAAEAADCVVLPLPLTRQKALIHTPLADISLRAEQVFSILRPEQIICGGFIPPAVHAQAAVYKLQLLDYYKREELAIAGAVATAEGAIQIAMENTSITLSGSRCLVIGFGRIGRALARRLQALGAAVTVAARSLADLAWIGADGYEEIHTDALEESLPGCDILFNTVPHLLLGAERLKLLDKEALSIDLSSSPGGIDLQEASKLGLQTIWALGLPGKVAPAACGKALRDTLYNILREQGKQL